VAELIWHALDRLRASDAVPAGQPSSAVLEALLRDTASLGPEAVIGEASVLRALGLGARPMTAGQAWQELARGCHFTPAAAEAAAWIAAKGTLAGRIRRALGEDHSLENIRRVYGRLCDCLATGTLFDA
jgi:carboxylate-amine ligase